MANIITLGRLLLLFLVLWMAHWTTGWLKLFTMVLLIVVFVSDTFDGYIARKQNETSTFGAMFIARATSPSGGCPGTRAELPTNAIWLPMPLSEQVRRSGANWRGSAGTFRRSRHRLFTKRSS